MYVKCLISNEANSDYYNKRCRYIEAVEHVVLLIKKYEVT